MLRPQKIWSAWLWSRELRRRGFSFVNSIDLAWAIERLVEERDRKDKTMNTDPRLKLTPAEREELKLRGIPPILMEDAEPDCTPAHGIARVLWFMCAAVALTFIVGFVFTFIYAVFANK